MTELDQDLKILHESLGDYHMSRLLRTQQKRDLLSTSKNAEGNYSITRLVAGLFENNAARVAPYELSESERISEKLGRQPRPGFAFIPISPATLTRRDLTSGVASGGGFLVQTENPGDVFVAALRNSSVMDRMGIPRIPVVGNAAVPVSGGSVATSWLSTEATPITEATHTFKLGVGTPKHIAAYCEASRTLLQSTSIAAQNFILSEMARSVAEAFDSALLNGSGASGQPLGLLNTTGIGAQSGASLAWAGVLNTIETVETAKGLVTPESAGWVVNPSSAEILRGRERAAGSGYIMDGNAMAGYRALSTGSVPAGTAVFGDWSGLATLEWGILEIGADPFGVNSALFSKGLVGLRAIWSCDLIVLRPASFCAVTSIT